MEINPQVQLAKALDLLLDVICIVDAEGRYVAVSAACEQVFGYTSEELIGKLMIDLVLPADRERTLLAAARVMDGQALRNFENRYVRKDGQVIDIMWSARWLEKDKLRLAVAREITLRKRAESMQAVLYGISEAAHSAEDLADLCQRIHEIMGDMLPPGDFMVALHERGGNEMSFPYSAGAFGPGSASCQRACGMFATAVIHAGAAQLLTPEKFLDWPDGMHIIAGAKEFDWLGVPLIADHQRSIGALVVRSHAATARYSAEHATLLQFVSTQIAANIERKQANARLQYLAQYDVLTGLPNRVFFDDRLRVALARTVRAQDCMALLYLDLDNFKQVNDSFGHATGDLLLQEAARRIQACVRDSDTVCRIGGDEFVVLLGALQAPQNALQVAQNICAAIHQPMLLLGHPVQVSSSIGIAIYPEDGSEQVLLARHADTAMYVAKQAGGNRCRLFSGGDTTAVAAALARP